MNASLFSVSDGPLRDLRRGLFRSFPFAAFGALSLFGDTATGVVAITFCLGWIPLTLIEGWAARRDWSRPTVTAAIAAVWVVVIALLAGTAVQFHYVRGLTQGLTPQAAMAAVSVSPRLVHDLAPVVAFLATVISTHAVVRVLAAQGRDGWEDWSTILLTMAAQALLASVVAGATDGGLIASLVFIALLVTATIGVAGLLILTLPADAAEGALWPPEAPAE